MKPVASSPPHGLAVQRHFESSRLAGACQARAYEQVLAGVGQTEFWESPAKQAEDAAVEIISCTKEGAVA